MSKKMVKVIAAAVNTGAVAAQTGIKLNETPFMGGGGSGGTAGGLRNAILHSTNLPPAGATVLIQGHDAIDGPPASGDAGWYTLATLNSTSPQRQEIELPRWIRTNVTVLTAGSYSGQLEGVQ